MMNMWTMVQSYCISGVPEDLMLFRLSKNFSACAILLDCRLTFAILAVSRCTT